MRAILATSGPSTERSEGCPLHVDAFREIVDKLDTPEFAPVTMINFLAVFTASTTPHS